MRTKATIAAFFILIMAAFMLGGGFALLGYAVHLNAPGGRAAIRWGYIGVSISLLIGAAALIIGMIAAYVDWVDDLVRAKDAKGRG